jgi:hypothetical protein
MPEDREPYQDGRTTMKRSTTHMSITEIHNGVSYSPPSSQRGYQPPTPTPEWRAPDVAAPAVNAEGSIVQQAHKKMVHANNEFRSHLDATEAIRANFSPEGYQAQIDAFQNTSGKGCRPRTRKRHGSSRRRCRQCRQGAEVVVAQRRYGQ